MDGNNSRLSHNISTTTSSTLQVPFKESTLVEVLSKPDALTISLFLVLLTLLSVGGNALVCRTIFVTRRLHFAGYYFVASLAVADFLVGIFVLPISLAYFITFNMKGNWIFGEPVCDAWILANLWFSSASVFSLCAVTWDRYVAVTSPLRYVTRMTDRCVTRLIVAIWLTSCVVAVVNLYGLKTSPSRVHCEVQGLPLIYSLFDFVLIFIIPLVSVIFVNCKIWITASRHLTRIRAEIPQAFEMNETQNNSTNVAPSMSQGRDPPPNHSLRREIKTFRTFLVVIGSFFCSWTPFYLMIVIDSFTEVLGFVAYSCVILTYINSATNPLVYGLFNREFRQALLKSFKCQRY